MDGMTLAGGVELRMTSMFPYLLHVGFLVLLTGAVVVLAVRTVRWAKKEWKNGERSHPEVAIRCMGVLCAVLLVIMLVPPAFPRALRAGDSELAVRRENVTRVERHYGVRNIVLHGTGPCELFFVGEYVGEWNGMVMDDAWDVDYTVVKDGRTRTGRFVISGHVATLLDADGEEVQAPTR